MSSTDAGKNEIVRIIRENFSKGASCLDVGACDGKWARLLGDYLTMDAVEIFNGNISAHRLWEKYRHVYGVDIFNFEYDWYDLIIFGDVLEHLTVERAQCVLEYARPRCKDLIIGVPFLWYQGEIYGNPYERHIQDDLTDEVFRERYPGYELLLKAAHNYAYYHKEQ